MWFLIDQVIFWFFASFRRRFIYSACWPALVTITAFTILMKLNRFLSLVLEAVSKYFDSRFRAVDFRYTYPSWPWCRLFDYSSWFLLSTISLSCFYSYHLMLTRLDTFKKASSLVLSDLFGICCRFWFQIGGRLCTKIMVLLWS
jgi:hypothetical protein